MAATATNNRTVSGDDNTNWTITGAQGTRWESVSNGVDTPVDTDYISNTGAAAEQNLNLGVPTDFGSIVEMRARCRYAFSTGKTDNKTLSVTVYKSDGSTSIMGNSPTYTNNGGTIGNEWQTIPILAGVSKRVDVFTGCILGLSGGGSTGTISVYEVDVEITYNIKTYDGQLGPQKKVVRPVSVYCWEPPKSAVNGTIVTDRMGRQDAELVHGGAPDIKFSERGPVYDLDTGTNTYIRIPNNKDHVFTDNANDKPFSLCMWYKHSDFIASRLAFTTTESNLYGGWEWFFTGGNLIQLLLSDGDEEGYVVRRGTTDYSTLGHSNEWVHLACTYDGRGGATAYNGIHLYINGEEIDTSYTDLTSGGTYGSMTNNYSDIWLGAIERVPDYNGYQIQDFRIYSIELSQGQLYKIYNTSKHDPMLWVRKKKFPWASINYSAAPPASTSNPAIFAMFVDI